MAGITGDFIYLFIYLVSIYEEPLVNDFFFLVS
jgi:hypothetical protein